MNERELVAQYLGGLVHTHTRLSNYPGHVESDLSIRELVTALVDAGLAGTEDAPIGFVMVNDHASNPVQPRALSPHSRRARALVRQRWTGTMAGVPVLYGFEASLLPGGGTDLTARLAAAAELVIASRHAWPEAAAADGAALGRLLEAACADPAVDALGHPARGIEGRRDVDWPAVLAAAARTGTAVEVNVNSYPEPHREPAREQWWGGWLRELAASGAPVLVGSDLHNRWQLAWWARDLHGALAGRPAAHNRVVACLRAMAEAGIGPERVVQTKLRGFRDWLALSKAERAVAGGDRP